MDPHWARLIRNYPNLTRGLTVPFVFGAVKLFTNAFAGISDDRNALKTLVRSLRDEAPAGRCAVIDPCGTAEKLIITTLDSEHPPADTVVLHSPWGGHRALYTYRIDQQDIHDLDTLADALWEQFGDEITAGHFSFENNRWRPFSAIERQQIVAALR